MDTHKFELHYFDRLIGPLPEAVSLYRERSPIFFADRIQDPLALFHGEDDTSVPRDQLDNLVAILRRRGVPHEVHVYPGEGHGFRKPETLEHYYRTVEQFLLQHVIWA
jgi:dipeptidyl aminopeptidase/acylaminoacyl peptidase